MRSPGRFASEQSSPLVRPMSRVPDPTDRRPVPEGARPGTTLLGFSDGAGGVGNASGTLIGSGAVCVLFGLDGAVGDGGVRIAAEFATAVGGLAAVSDKASAIGGGAAAAAKVRSRDSSESTVETRGVRSQPVSAATMSSGCEIRRVHTNLGCDIFLSILLR